MFSTTGYVYKIFRKLTLIQKLNTEQSLAPINKSISPFELYSFYSI
ncbi:MAG: hypothetical protein ACI8SJ_000585 [Shewanella sp.]|jgi:hypothetical protein